MNHQCYQYGRDWDIAQNRKKTQSIWKNRAGNKSQKLHKAATGAPISDTRTSQFLVAA